ncbi:FAD-binding oxidoreductase [Halomarina oriensis]|uniref:FAD-binding protein n=1 Tax=Halomarina oriensis TaxID=671145 RepID=A0A6B0GLB9_9EURY|nr:FAD-binding oxidoreductase [Halomarina oriensis]MWG34249.1 FAD-binding protein [Halomarina oriensis]
MEYATRTPSESLVSELRAAVDGDVVTPSDAAYEEACSLWNGAVEKRPALVVRAVSTDDVSTAVTFAREQGLPLGVRGGGHHVTGSALVDDGLVVDLSGMTGVSIDPDARVARVGPGARVSDVLDPAQEYGLAPIVGSAAQNGIAGSTLGGGIGWLRRAHGLGVDHLRAVELVTVEGTVLRASPEENPDLFWGVRGGGPNFGVVTAFEFDLVEVGPEVMIAQVVYPADAADDVLRRFREWSEDAPREATTLVVVMHVPPLAMVPPEAHGAPVVMVFSVYAGAVEDGERALAPLRELGEPLMDMSGPMPLAAVHEVARDLFPDGRRYAWHSLYADDLSEDVVDVVTDAFADAPSLESELGIWHLGGAIRDVDEDGTAFGYRDAEFMITVDAAWDDPEADTENRAWAERHWEALGPHCVDGSYPGFPGPVDAEERGRMAYGENYDRLAALKATYDPENLLRSNVNVEPAGDR